MHRSGTSALSGLIASLGAQPPKTPLKPTADNPKGYFESKPLMLFNDTVLEAIGSAWDNIMPADPHARKQYVVTRTNLDKIQALMSEEFGEHPLIVVKDPRICLLSDLWMQALKEAEIQPCPVMMLRNPLEVARSLQARDKIPINVGLLLWLRYTLEAERASRGLPRAIISYQQLIEDESSVVERLRTSFETGGPSLNAPQYQSGFVEASLRHHEAKEDELIHWTQTADWVLRTYRIIERMMSGKIEDMLAHFELDQIRDEFDRTCNRLQPVLAWRTSQLQNALSNIDIVQGQLNQTAQMLQAADSNLAEQRNRNAEKASALEEKASALKEKTAAIADLSSRMTMLEGQNSTLRAEFQLVSDLIDSEVSRYGLLPTGDLRARLAQLSNLVDEASQHSDRKEMQAELARLQQELESLQAQLGEKDRLLERRTEELDYAWAREAHLSEKFEIQNANYSETIREMDDHHTNAMQALTVRFTGVVEEMSTRQIELTEKTESMSEREQDLLRKVETLSKREEDLAQELESLNQNNDKLKEQLVGLKSTSGELSVAVLKAGHTIRTLETDLQKTTTKAQQVENLSKTIDDLRRQIEQSRNRETTAQREARRAANAIQFRQSPSLRDKLRLQRMAKEVKASGLFDAAFYAQALKSRKITTDMPLVHHYLMVGELMSISPQKMFDVQYYLNTNDDVVDSPLPALVHYIRFGHAEGRSPHPLFDTAHYNRSVEKGNRNRKRDKLNPLMRFIEFGGTERGNPSPYFDCDYYLRTNPDVAKAGLNPLIHYMSYGFREYRSPNPEFDEKWYRDKYADHLPSNMSGLEYHLREGGLRGFTPNPNTPMKIKRRAGAKVQTVLVVAHSASDRIFGSERSLLEVLSVINRDKYRIILALPDPSLTYIEATRTLVDKVVRYKRRWWNVNRDPDELVIEQFSELIQRENVRAVYANTIVIREALMAARELGIPTACHVRELIDSDVDLQAAIGLPPRQVIEEVVERSDYIVANSIVTADLYQKPDRVFTILNAVDTNALDIAPRQRDENRLKVGMLSSNITKKGLQDLFQLAKAAAKRDMPVDFYAYGPITPDVEKIEAEIAARGGPNNIHFPGYAENAADAIASVDIVVNLSRFAESFGRTAAEGMAARRPVIAYNHGALPSVIKDGVTGFLIPFGSPLSAINCLDAFLKDQDMLRDMGEAGRERAIRLFSLEVLAFNVNAVLDAVIAGKDAFELRRSADPSAKFREFSVPRFGLADPDAEPAPISVVVPNYNYADYLPERLQSIFDQTHKPTEIIFLDDCSPDNSLEVAEQMLSEQANKPGGIPYRIIPNETNQGVYRQWLRGLQEAENEWVWIAEADDTCDSYFLQALTAKVKDGVNVVYAQSRKIDEHSSVVAPDFLAHTNDLSKSRWLEDFTEPGAQAMLQAMAFRNTIPNTSSAIMRKTAVEGAEDTLVTYRFVGDWFLYAHMLSTGGLAYVSQPLNNFRRHTQSVTRQQMRTDAYLVELARVREYISSRFPVLPRHVERQDWFLNRDYKIEGCEKNTEHPDIQDLLAAADAHTRERHRIAIITTNNGSYNGGSEMLWQETAIALREAGHDVVVLIKRWEPVPPLFDELFKAGVKVVFKEESGFVDLLESKPNLAIVSIGDQDEGIEYYPDLTRAGIPYVIVNQLTKERRVWPIREKKKPAVREGYLGAHTVFFTCRNNQAVMEDRLDCALPNADIHFNPYHIDRDRPIPYPPLDQGLQVAIPSKLLFIHKGQDLLVELGKTGRWTDRDITFNFYGAGPDRETLEHEIEEHGLTNFHIKGRVDDISDIWRDNHALLMPSRMEGLPIMIVSAMLSGRMCVATDVGGHAEVITEGMSGYIIPDHTVEDLERVLETAWSRRNEWQEMGQHARQDILNFLPEDPVADFVQRLAAILDTQKNVTGAPGDMKPSEERKIDNLERSA